MSVARRRMQALMSAFGEAGIVDDGRWTTGWLRTDEIRRTRQWVYRNPNFNSHSRVRTASQAVKLVTDTQRARGTNERDAQVQQMENTLRLNRKRIQHLEDLVIVTTHQCHVYQEDLKLEEQRTSLLKRKFAEGCIGSMSNDELKAADSNCRAKISQIEEEIYRRVRLTDDKDDSSCYICKTETNIEGTCKNCSNGWCRNCESKMERCPYCREPIPVTNA